MIVNGYKTRPLIPPQDNLFEVMDELLYELEEYDVVVVSSKVVAIWQGRCVLVPKKTTKELKKFKEDLIKKESELYLPSGNTKAYSRLFTIYEKIFGSSSGIDESNANGHYILLPKNLYKTAKEIRSFLIDKKGLKKVGVIISDSQSRPMRNGASSISLSHAGFNALKDYRGKKDIFGRTMQFERVHVADEIAAAANLVMGEGSECVPFAICRGVPDVTFTETEPNDEMLASEVSMDQDVFARFLLREPWQKGGNYHDRK